MSIPSSGQNQQNPNLNQPNQPNPKKKKNQNQNQNQPSQQTQQTVHQSQPSNVPSSTVQSSSQQASGGVYSSLSERMRQTRQATQQTHQQASSSQQYQQTSSPNPNQRSQQPYSSQSQQILQQPGPTITNKQYQQQQHQQSSSRRQVIVEEYDETAELMRKRLPKIYNLERSKQLVIKNSKMEVFDVQMKAPDSEQILWTTLQIIANPFEQLRPFEADSREGEKICYMVLKGRGEIMTSELRKKITEGDIFFVEKGVRHNLNNLSETDQLVLVAHYPGYLDARDIYKPFTQAHKKAAESRQQFFASGSGGKSEQQEQPIKQEEVKKEGQVTEDKDPGKIARDMDMKYV